MLPDKQPPAPFTPEFYQDPYRTYTFLREYHPVYPTMLPSTDERTWLISRYEDIRAVLVDHKRFSNSVSTSTPSFRIATDTVEFDPHDESVRLPPGVGLVDPPDHTRIRSRVSKAFTPRRISQFAEVIRGLSEELLDKIDVEPGPVDILRRFAFTLPVAFLCELFGATGCNLDELVNDVWHVSPGADQHLTLEREELLQARRSTRNVVDWSRDLIGRKRADPGDDVLSDLLALNEVEEELTEGELIVAISTILVAGTDSLAYLLGNAFLGLLDHPDQMRLLQESPELAESAIEEFMRYEPPVSGTLWRFPREDVTIAGVLIPAHEAVMLLLGSANRDPARFVHPETLDITRRDNPQIGFGQGIHACFGAALARLEGKIALPMLVQRFPTMALAVPRQEIRYRTIMVARALQALPVYLHGHP